MPIVAGFDSLAWVVNHYKIDKIVIGTRKLAPEAVGVLQVMAGALGLEVAEVSFTMRWLGATGRAVEPGAVAEPSVAVGGNGNGGARVAVAAGVGVGGNGHGAVADLRVAG